MLTKTAHSTSTWKKKKMLLLSKNARNGLRMESKIEGGDDLNDDPMTKRKSQVGRKKNINLANNLM
jgi:hypothetical protein